MPIIGVSIEKEVVFRDSTQPFSNVYYYNNGIGTNPSESEADGIINTLVAWEKQVHSGFVTFKYARLWNQGLTQALSQMIKQKALSGTGASAIDSNQDKERAFLFRWRAGVDNRGNPVYLRKWFHCAGQFGTQSGVISSSLNSNDSGFSNAVMTAMANKVEEIRTIAGNGGPWNLCAKSGRGISEGQAQSHRYLEHRQLGDQWRGG